MTVNSLSNQIRSLVIEKMENFFLENWINSNECLKLFISLIDYELEKDAATKTFNKTFKRIGNFTLVIVAAIVGSTFGAIFNDKGTFNQIVLLSATILSLYIMLEGSLILLSTLTQKFERKNKLLFLKGLIIEYQIYSESKKDRS